MTQGGTYTQIIYTTLDMVSKNFLKASEVNTVFKHKNAGLISEGEVVEMLQELVDVASIKLVCGKQTSH